MYMCIYIHTEAAGTLTYFHLLVSSLRRGTSCFAPEAFTLFSLLLRNSESTIAPITTIFQNKIGSSDLILNLAAPISDGSKIL